MARRVTAALGPGLHRGGRRWPAPADVPSRARLPDLCAAEWIKLRSLRSTMGMLALAALLAVGFAAFEGDRTASRWPAMTAGSHAAFNPLLDAYEGTVWTMLILVAGLVGALGLAGEFASGMIRTTMTAVPDRSRVVLAKALVTGVLLFLAGTAVSVASFAVSQAELRSRHVGYSFGHPGAVRAILASALVLPAAGLVGMGIGAVVRNLAGTVFAATAILALLPSVNGTRAFLQNAWSALSASASGTGPRATLDRADAVGSWLSLVVWASLGVVVAVLAVRRRDL
jgi:ABC-2 type transport system permease protein